MCGILPVFLCLKYTQLLRTRFWLFARKRRNFKTHSWFLQNMDSDEDPTKHRASSEIQIVHTRIIYIGKVFGWKRWHFAIFERKNTRSAEFYIINRDIPMAFDTWLVSTSAATSVIQFELSNSSCKFTNGIDPKRKHDNQLDLNKYFHCL